jgi:hypothetical protein
MMSLPSLPSLPSLTAPARQPDHAEPDALLGRPTCSIDVVVPCYQYGRYLRECVHSVLAQDLPRLRVLILDDASYDETLAVGTALAREDARVHYVCHAQNRGHIATFNEGIDWVDADCMLLLSADDYLLPGALRRALALMTRHPEVGLCFGEAVELRDDGTRAHIRVDLPATARVAQEAVLTGTGFIGLCIRAGAANVVATPTAVVRTGLLRRVGGYRPELPHTGDFELWLRLAAHAPVGVICAEQAVYRRHAANMSLAYHRDNLRADLAHRRLAFEVFAEACASAPIDLAALHRGLLDGLARAAVGHASSAFNAGDAGASRRLRAFARSIDPGVHRRAAWQLLALKTLLGRPLSNRLLAARAWARTCVGGRP